MTLTTTISTNAIAATAFSVDDICAEWGGKELESSGFSDNKLMGFYLSRRVQYGNNWHPVDDDLRGTAVYGTPPTNPTHGPTGSGTGRWSSGGARGEGVRASLESSKKETWLDSS